MAKYIEPESLVGVRFNRLVCIGFEKKEGKEYLQVECDCGKTKTVVKKRFTRGDLISCGCAKMEHIKRLNLPENKPVRTTHKMTNTPEYTAWKKYEGSL